ncbi:MAG: starch synthase [Bacteroidia bacterium]
MLEGLFFLSSRGFSPLTQRRMSQKERVLFVSQNITPYLPESPMGLVGRHLPQGIQERGREIRTFMPRFGCINERRNQLHEVIRLSGMNLIIDDNDHPLIIKVASIQAARMQVYFIDNEEYFKRKFVFDDADGTFYADNDERAIFFCRGVIETVKKLGWAPDIIHCHGWMTAILPFYIRTAYKDDPIFENAKIITSVYDDAYQGELNTAMADKIVFGDLEKEEAAIFGQTGHTSLVKAQIKYSDALVKGSPELASDIDELINSSELPVLDYAGEEDYMDVFSGFYDEILSENGVLAE